jgi:hypothetical protein
MRASAVLSLCGGYRYCLRRTWDPALPCLVFLCLNPSTATSIVTDATTKKCIDIASTLGFGSIMIANLFAARSPYPSHMKKSLSPIGPRNNRLLVRLARSGAKIVAAWGTHGGFRGRAAYVTAMFPSLSCLGRTKYGFPRHPLSVRKPYGLYPYP